MTGCIGRRYLKDNERLLVEQKLSGGKGLNKEDIESLYEYTPNGRVLFLPWSPYVTLYQAGLKRYDSIKYENKKVRIAEKYDQKIAKAEGKEKKLARLRAKKGKKIDKQNQNIKEGNLAMRLGEPLAVFDTAKEKTTAENIEAYLHSKGYFNSSVTYETEEQFKLVTTTYSIEKNQPYVVDSIFYNIADERISQIFESTKSASLIQIGDNYEQQKLVDERERINLLMLNNGYYDFNRRFLSFDVDSAYLGGKKVVVGINIQNPVDQSQHKVFKIDSVIFTTDANITGISALRFKKEYNNVAYQYYSRRYSEKILDRRLFLYPDSIYRRDNTFETQKQLSNLDMFKFININYDTTGGHFIANVFLSPLKKYETSSEVGLNVSKGLPGPFVFASIKNRNTFRGLEIMELSGRVGFEGLSGATETGSPYSSLEYGINLGFTFPQFLFPLSQKFKSRIGRFNPKTKLSFGLNFIDRTEYLRNNINTALTYSWRNYDKNRMYTFALADINYINSDLTDSYREFLENLQEQGNNLILSFEPSFVNSTWFSSTYNINDYGNKKQKSSYFRYVIEHGGNLSQILKNASIIQPSITTYQFAKFRADFRHSKPVNSSITLAYRVNMGVAYPYGDNQTLPYEKFFFAGGSNSIRAWTPRRLGPGSYAPINAEGEYNNSYEQPGEILLEMSAEFRHKWFGFVHGAIFVDAGNVWTLREDPVRPGSKFEFNNVSKEIALGAGYGIRFDLSFLLLRLDAAWKIYDPAVYRDPEGNEIPFDLRGSSNYQRLVWNLGIGYPF